MVSNLQFLAQNSSNLTSDMAAELSKVPGTGVQMAIAFVAILPIIVVFPFLQKYYAKGISLGAVKG
jgi:putative aldouronate transport system permease protein